MESLHDKIYIGGSNDQSNARLRNRPRPLRKMRQKTTSTKPKRMPKMHRRPQSQRKSKSNTTKNRHHETLRRKMR